MLQYTTTGNTTILDTLIEATETHLAIATVTPLARFLIDRWAFHQTRISRYDLASTEGMEQVGWSKTETVLLMHDVMLRHFKQS